MKLYVKHGSKIANKILSCHSHNVTGFFFLLFDKRPPVVKVDQAIALSDLRRLLPSTVFKTYLSGEGVESENILSTTMGVFGVVVMN